MSKIPWHVRHIRSFIYAALFITIVSIALFSIADAPDATQAWVESREFYGLWALALLAAAMLPGPLNFVLPWLPIRPHLVLGRRALGVSAFILAVLHIFCYLAPTIWRNWHNLYKPGVLWIAGQVIGLALFTDMAILAFTSRDKEVRRLGPQRWKRLHRSVYILLPGALAHATLLGADFGVNKGPDVVAEPDDDSLVTMLIVTAVWLLLFVLRKRRVRWTPPMLESSKQ